MKRNVFSREAVRQMEDTEARIQKVLRRKKSVDFEIDELLLKYEEQGYQEEVNRDSSSDEDEQEQKKLSEEDQKRLERVQRKLPPVQLPMIKYQERAQLLLSDAKYDEEEGEEDEENKQEEEGKEDKENKQEENTVKEQIESAEVQYTPATAENLFDWDK